MKNSELFLEIKKDMERYKFKVKNNEGIDENIDSINIIMSNYNRDNFNEIMNLSYVELDEEIPDEDLNDFKKRIEHFFNLYAPEDKEFKEFIKAISLYLTFIAKKPLHPPGIKFSNGSRVYKNQDFYYCTKKSKFIEDKLSLCKYCVSKQVNTI